MHHDQDKWSTIKNIHKCMHELYEVLRNNDWL